MSDDYFLPFNCFPSPTNSWWLAFCKEYIENGVPDDIEDYCKMILGAELVMSHDLPIVYTGLRFNTVQDKVLFLLRYE